MRFLRVVFLLVVPAMIAGLPVAASEVIQNPLAIAPGTRGVCLTEMDGGGIERIPVTVLGTQGPTTPEGERIIVRLDDPRFAKTGIIAGMSGSPVYVDGKLLGALAFGWPFEREPIGGVTPFVRMLSLEGGGTETPGGGSRPTLAEIAQGQLDGDLGDLVLDWLAPWAKVSGGGLPLAMTLGGSRSPLAHTWLGRYFARLGFAATSGGAGNGRPSQDDRVRPGAMVAVVLIDGDANMAAGGTVTEVRGDKVWAFGHPFLGGGSVRLPLARAHVSAVLPNFNASFKFFTVGPMVGAIASDRSRGVFARLGAEAPMVPVNVDASGRAYHYRVARNRTLLPMLVAYLVQASHNAHGRRFGDQSLRMKIEVAYADGETARLEDAVARADAPASASALAAAVVGYLGASPFEPPEIESVNITLASEERDRSATLIEAVPERTVVRPGATLPVQTRWRVRRGKDIERRLSIRVPDYVTAGPLDLVVADGAAWTAYDLKARPLRPDSFADELRLVQRIVPASSVVVALERRDPGVALDGGTISTPPSIMLSLGAGLDGNVKTVAYGVAAREVADLGMPLSGALRLHLVVRSDGVRRGSALGAPEVK